MERDDEIRAMQVIAKTLAKLSPEGARRVLEYTMDRYGGSTGHGAQVAEPRPLGEG